MVLHAFPWSCCLRLHRVHVPLHMVLRVWGLVIERFDVLARPFCLSGYLSDAQPMIIDRTDVDD